MVASIETPFAPVGEPVEIFRFVTIKSPKMTLSLIPESFIVINVVARTFQNHLAKQDPNEHSDSVVTTFHPPPFNPNSKYM